MALLDVSFMLTDPDFVNTVPIIRRQKVTGSNGRVTFTETSGTIVGCVQPASGDTLVQLPELSNTTGSLEVWTQAELNVDTASQGADILTWQGSRYIVAAKVDNYQHYGNGFTHAVLTLQDMVTQ